MSNAADTNAVRQLVDHLFRRSAGQMVSALTRFMGAHNLDVAEEVVQEALLKALQSWPYRGIPDNPSGWLMQVARNAALDRLRRERSYGQKLSALYATVPIDEASTAIPSLAEAFADDELQMILMCCHPELPREARVALTLTTVGGFGVSEIARAFLAKPATVAQRVVRAKRLIREKQITFAMPRPVDIIDRLTSVLEVIYLMFNEGYAAHEGDDLVRTELCHESIRLASIIVRNPATTLPQVHALLALMYLQASRLTARTDGNRCLVLLAEQDRSQWDRRQIALGMKHLALSAQGHVRTTYHVEAGIAACHAAAESYAATDWHRILEGYDELAAVNPSPVVLLNRAVAIGMLHGPDAALRALGEVQDDPALAEYYLLPATEARFQFEVGNVAEAVRCFRRALALRCSGPERRFVENELAKCAERGHPSGE